VEGGSHVHVAVALLLLLLSVRLPVGEDSSIRNWDNRRRHEGVDMTIHSPLPQPLVPLETIHNSREDIQILAPTTASWNAAADGEDDADDDVHGVAGFDSVADSAVCGEVEEVPWRNDLPQSPCGTRVRTGPIHVVSLNAVAPPSCFIYARKSKHTQSTRQPWKPPTKRHLQWNLAYRIVPSCVYPLSLPSLCREARRG
jgi:hypothetical protein